MGMIKIRNINLKKAKDEKTIDLRQAAILPPPDEYEAEAVSRSPEAAAIPNIPLAAGSAEEAQPADPPPAASLSDNDPEPESEKTAFSPAPEPEPVIESRPAQDLRFKTSSLPSEQKIKKIEEELAEENRQEEIEESLSEIYQDDNGDMVNVQELEIKKKRGWVFWMSSFLITAGLLGAAAYGLYYLYMQQGTDAAAVELSIEGKSEAMAGEEFIYLVNYQNLSNVTIKNLKIEATYPENFIFISSEPSVSNANNVWQLPDLAGHRSAQLQIRGRLVGPADSNNVIAARLTYTPSNFSSEFKKEFTYSTLIKDIGINMDFDYIASSMVGETNEIGVRFSAKENNNLHNFRMTLVPADNMELINPSKASTSGSAPGLKDSLPATTTQEISPGVWQASEVSAQEQEIRIFFRFREKISDKQDVILSFEQDDGSGKFRKFLDKAISYEVVKNNLNLAMIVNGTRDGGGVDFGQTMNYSIIYSNKGEEDLRDVVIMAVLNGPDYLDWTTLMDKNRGRLTDNTITWSKEEIADLALLPQGKEGVIDFSIRVASSTDLDVTKDYQIKSYAQFSLTSSSSPRQAGEDARSNTVIMKINSDLGLKEEIRYFSDDNIPVGVGPLPPKVGQTTSFKIYWTVTNNLHELSETRVEAALPANVKWEGKNSASVGTLQYDQAAGKVIWLIGRMPITVPNATAEFSVSITPGGDDRDKIMVILPGANLTATDSVTKAQISKSIKAKTTRLEDDLIANIDGRVVE